MSDWAIEQTGEPWVPLDGLVIGNPEECWVWTGGVTGLGYGRLKVDGVSWRAHRLIWTIAHRTSIPAGGVIHHICENKLCCNPAHLQLTTPSIHNDLHRSPTCQKCGHNDWLVSSSRSTNRECRECRRQTFRHRYANDPVWRERRLARKRAWQAQRKSATS